MLLYLAYLASIYYAKIKQNGSRIIIGSILLFIFRMINQIVR